MRLEPRAADNTTVLAWLFLLLIFGGFVIGQFAAQTATAGGSGVRTVLEALAYQPPKRVREGYTTEILSRARSGSVAAETETAGAGAADVNVVIEMPKTAAAPAPTPRAAPPDLLAGGRARVANTNKLGVKLRAAPQRDARVPGALREGARVLVLDRAGDEWARVGGENGLEGWVPIRYLAPLE